MHIAPPPRVRFILAFPGANPRLMRKKFLRAILTIAVSVLTTAFTHAGSATWDLNPQLRRLEYGDELDSPQRA
jgi:hypothetical protein